MSLLVKQSSTEKKIYEPDLIQGIVDLHVLT